MNQVHMDQLNQWHEDDEHQRIVDALLAIPENERDYETISRLARAYNNLELYEEALHHFDSIAEAGQHDPLWHYRVGFALYHVNRYVDAVQELRIADQLEPGDEDIEYLMQLSVQRAEKQQRQERRIAAKKEAALKASGSEVVEPFSDMSLDDFWEDSEYAREAYQSEPPTAELIASIEEELGYKLPSSYIALMKQRNGGVPKNTCFPTEDPTSWAEDHIAISGIMGIGREKSYSLGGDLGSQFMIEDWGYPDIGVVICDCPSAGHDVVMLDYRACGRDGEPEVIHVDQEDDYEVTFLADNFEAFIRGLVSAEEYDTSEEDKLEDLHRVAHGKFSPLLEELCANIIEVDQIEQRIRRICTRIVEEKGHFSFHADERSYLMYDVQFWLYTKSYPETSREQYLGIYEKMIAFGGEFGQGGYAPSFISDWLDRRKKEGRIVQVNGHLRFTEQSIEELVQQLQEA
ncbi:SMI1/KNR4 family protein [Paenibacillus sp. MER 180]|uniref:SMI1/KNR4 family protein n=1 Tax=unclassified Paenibacillus TaxID=185978 RepID=UPI0008065C41|nr:MULTISPECIES: SMI1/KNR4 family protein [unclassified Paenibacillus]MCM3293398.1 SMI1/KNR4 family protein [Paenibacillus sp. MER 180]OBY80740.1 glucan biosynthesis protein [Paenibacillus sp. KS1]